MLLATAAIGMTDVALAQRYPERTVEITVPSSPGATADLLGRVLAEASPSSSADASSSSTKPPRQA